MKRRLSLLCYLCVIGACLLILSCTEAESSRSTLHVSLSSDDTISRTLIPEDTPLEVSRYCIEGDGPQGTTFSVVSTNSAVDVQGLLVGSWQLYAVGQNSRGVDLVSGSAAVTLTKEPTKATIELDSLAGIGTLSIEFLWDSSMITNPSLEVRLTDEAEKETLLTAQTNDSGHGLVRYRESLDAGSYLLQAQLFSGSSLVAGCAEVVRIVGARTTEAVIELPLDKYGEIPTTITLVDNLGTPIECTISGLSETVVANEQVTVELISEEEPLQVSWFLNGGKIAQGMQCIFTPESGEHRLDVIAAGALLASSGSASISFTAIVGGESGIPVLVNTVGDNAVGINIGQDSHAAFLPDGKILLASTHHQTLQVCRIVRDSLQVVHTYTTADSFNCTGVAALFVDPLTYRVVVSNTDNPKVVVYQYDLTDSALIKLFEDTNTYGSTAWGSGTFPYLRDFTLDRVSGNLYGLHPQKPVIVEKHLYTADPSQFYSPYYYTEEDSETEPFAAMALSPNCRHTALSLTEASILLFYDKADGYIGENFNYVEEFAPPATHYLSKINRLIFLDNSTLAYSTKRDLGIFRRSGNHWVQEDVFTSLYEGWVPEMEGIVAMQYNGSSTLYLLCKESKNIVCFSFSPAGELSLVGACSLGSYTPGSMTLAPDGEHLIVTSPVQSDLLLFRIPR